MKYKVGDEVLVKGNFSGISKNGNCIIETDEFEFFTEKDKVIPVPDMTAEEAWEIAKKILLYPAHGGFNATELEEIFGRTEHLWELTPQQAKAKIEAWEAENEIKVGDEVEMTYSGNKFFVSQIDSDNQDFPYNGFDKNFGIYHDWSRNQLKKTGRHIDIEGLLKQIGGNE